MAFAYLALRESGSIFTSPNLEVFEIFQNFGLLWQWAFEEHKKCAFQVMLRLAEFPQSNGPRGQGFADGSYK